MTSAKARFRCRPVIGKRDVTDRWPEMTYRPATVAGLSRAILFGDHVAFDSGWFQTAADLKCEYAPCA